MRPVNTRRTPTAIRKYANANAILAITINRREPAPFARHCRRQKNVNPQKKGGARPPYSYLKKISGIP